MLCENSRELRIGHRRFSDKTELTENVSLSTEIRNSACGRSKDDKYLSSPSDFLSQTRIEQSNQYFALLPHTPKGKCAFYDIPKQFLQLTEEVYRP
jgi:hypothetical protein